MIKELCQSLVEKRNQMGISIEEVVDKTKLCPSVIRDIEEGNLTNISTTYVRGFIKIYASFLGVEIPAGTFDEVVSSQKSIKEQQKKMFVNKAVMSKPIASTGQGKPSSGVNLLDKAKEKLPPPARKNVKRVVVGIIAFFIFFNFTKFVFHKIFGHKEDKKTAQSQQDSPSSGRETAATAVAAADSAVADTIDTSLKAKRDCFVRVRVDGNLLFEGILNKGTVEMWKAKKEVEFKISDGSAVYLEVNGDPLPPLTSMRKPIKSLKITHSGISVDK